MQTGKSYKLFEFLDWTRRDIYVVWSPAATVAVKDASSTIPVVFMQGAPEAQAT